MAGRLVLGGSAGIGIVAQAFRDSINRELGPSHCIWSEIKKFDCVRRMVIVWISLLVKDPFHRALRVMDTSINLMFALRNVIPMLEAATVLRTLLPLVLAALPCNFDGLYELVFLRCRFFLTAR